MLLAACSSVAPPLTAPPQALPLAQRFATQVGEGGRLERLDAASALRIHVFRAGRAARLGHNHVLAVPRLEGLVWRPSEAAEDLAGARFELQFRLDEMLLDPPALRAALGAGWASTVSPEAVAATRLNMLGSLQAEAFPWVRIRSLQITGEAPKLAARVEIELHGQKREQWLPLHAEIGADGLKASGALVLRQSDFGITPFSVGAGLLAVSDELLVEFQLQTSPSNGKTSTNAPAATSP